MNVVKIYKKYKQLEADGKFDQKRSEEKEEMMMLPSAFCFHFPFCSSARLEYPGRKVYCFSDKLLELTIN